MIWYRYYEKNIKYVLIDSTVSNRRIYFNLYYFWIIDNNYILCNMKYCFNTFKMSNYFSVPINYWHLPWCIITIRFIWNNSPTASRSPVDALESTCVRPDTEEHLKSLGAGKPKRTPKNHSTPTCAMETLYACPVVENKTITVLYTYLYLAYVSNFFAENKLKFSICC